MNSQKLKDVAIPYKDMILRIPNLEGALENEGRLSKIWVVDEEHGRQYLIKASGFYGYEPLTEKLAYIVGYNLGFDVLRYDIIDAKYLQGILKILPTCKYLSICERVDINGLAISSIRDIKNAMNFNREEKLLNREVMYQVLDRDFINKLLIFDAIIGNIDRHYGNVHVLVDSEGNISGAPIMDNGACLLSTYTLPELWFGQKWVDTLFDKSYTLEKKHKLQREWIDNTHIFNDLNVSETILEIDSQIQDTLKLLPSFRAKMVEKYLIKRLHTYLIMFK